MDRMVSNGFGRAKRTPRVTSACQRCRRHKLKCDSERPCALCIRSGVSCISENRPTYRKRRGVNRNGISRPAQPPPDRSGPAGRLLENLEATLGNEIVTPEVDADTSQHIAEDNHDPGNQNASWFGSNVRISSAGMTQEIIDQFSPKTVLGSSTSALPGGSKPDEASKDPLDCSISVRDALDFDFPPKPVADFLLETYLGAVHWFMMVFHQPTFRCQYEAILTGAHYTTEDRVRAYCATFDLEGFRKRSLAKVEECLLNLLDSSNVESVQVCVILGSFYLYHGRPNLAFVVLGAGIRCSQIMGLYKEFSWRGISEIDKEERRRTFWALYVFDRFASIVYGKPCSIQREEIDVNMPQNLGDTTIQHPQFHTVTAMPDGITEPVTTFTYVKFKIKMYQIASPIVTDVYFHKNTDLNSLATKVIRIDKQLRKWFSSLPPELKLEQVSRQGIKEPPQDSRLFMLQALALQLAYDNVQILLHRPFLSQNMQNLAPGPSGERNTCEDIASTSPLSSCRSPSVHCRGTQSALLTSKDHCWESAIQSSNLGLYGQCLEYARETHAAAFLGINLFTASMVLCVFALSNPISTQAQLAKQAVTRIMSLSRFLANRSILSGQTNQVLRDLVNLILEKERRVILSEDRDPAPARFSYNQVVSTSRDILPMNTGLPLQPESFERVRDNDMIVQSPYNEQNSVPHTPIVEELANEAHSIPDFGNLNFDDGISTLQEAMFPGAQTQETWNIQSDVGVTSGQLHSGDRIMNSDIDVTNSIWQTWLWNPFPESYRG